MKKQYSVSQGWIRYRQVGSHVEERFSDSPFVDQFDTYEEARATYDAIDLERDWNTEKMCAGSAWRYDQRDAYKELSEYEVDEDDEFACAENVNILEFEKFGDAR